MGAAARRLEALPQTSPATLPSRRRRRPRHQTPPGRRRPAGRNTRRRRLVGRSAHVVVRLPESAAIRKISGSRLWIALIGLLLIGIVAINVLTVSYGAMSSAVEADIEKLERQNSILRSQTTRALSLPRVRNAASAEGMKVPATDEIRYREFAPEVFATAAQRLAAEGG